MCSFVHQSRSSNQSGMRLPQLLTRTSLFRACRIALPPPARSLWYVHTVVDSLKIVKCDPVSTSHFVPRWTEGFRLQTLRAQPRFQFFLHLLYLAVERSEERRIYRVKHDVFRVAHHLGQDDVRCEFARHAALGGEWHSCFWMNFSRIPFLSQNFTLSATEWSYRVLQSLVDCTFSSVPCVPKLKDL